MISVIIERSQISSLVASKHMKTLSNHKYSISMLKNLCQIPATSKKKQPPKASTLSIRWKLDNPTLR